MNIQDIIANGRFIFANAPKRLEVFKLVNGRRNAKEIAKKVGKPLVPTLNDLQKIKDIGLVDFKKDLQGKKIQKEGSIIYEKIPLVKQLSLAYFSSPIKSQAKIKKVKIKEKTIQRKVISLSIPSETEILDICKNGEDQLYEFKSPGTDVQKMSKEIAAFLHTKLGGIIFYGVEDDGTLLGTDKTRQQIDQPLQNSVRNSIAPSAIIRIVQKEILGQKILLILVSPWNKKDVYLYQGKPLIRKGTNVFGVAPEELRKLHEGKYII